MAAKKRTQTNKTAPGAVVRAGGKRPTAPTGDDVTAYHAALPEADRAICELLRREIGAALPRATAKVWHGSPVWFLEGNPIVGYHKLKDGVRLLFWSGQSFEAPGLSPEGSFKAAEVRYRAIDEVEPRPLRRWLKESRLVQWDYQHIVKRQGRLVRLR